ncbi:hypothetical protein AC579_5999 [Pseudocercospora musae]|uniref:Carrier domain-containing protein n=1 Tax=Pseudocercospora musae TaxID=113226 RepID=A0A139I0Z4_9PEZI|nr:hypothetical protein AC579_5999 [Pseudocercospora musae]
MAPPFVANIHDPDYRGDGRHIERQPPSPPVDDRINVFRVDDLAAEDDATPSGIRENIVLLAWLIVLLRTREGTNVNFEWAYKSQTVEHEPARRNLSLDKVTKGLQDSVADVTRTIKRQSQPSIETYDAAISNPIGLLLSTSSLLHTSEEAKEEGILHLELRYEQTNLYIHERWRSSNILDFTAKRYKHCLFDTIRQCLTNPSSSIQSLLHPTPHDIEATWGWNHDLPPTYNFCMNEMIFQRANEYPEKVGIDSWDGILTYSQIDQYSTSMAHALKSAGVQHHDVLPICFEKSRWTIIAVLATMKVGATFAMMDPSLPLARLQNMATQVNAKRMLCSREVYRFASQILPQESIHIIEESKFSQLTRTEPALSLDPVSPDTLMYIIFTSGSTGTPKGVTISHSTYTSSAIPRAAAVGYTTKSRVLDFASYAFDVSIDSMLLTLGNGGTLCIPSDEERLNDINGAIRRYKINYAGLTPSVGRILDEDVIRNMDALGLGGEAVSARDCNEIWGKLTRIVIGYGPCECTIGCTVNSSAATGRDYISIGPGNGACIWIVDPNDHEVLMPVGAVGEILVEGPIVGQGYLNDPKKTAEAFIEDPKWLLKGCGKHRGRRGRLYKTGDLGKYDPDGSGGIVFAGRKDTQVKLRGQRVELGEIESQLRARLPSDFTVIAEVLQPEVGQAQLVAFVSQGSGREQKDAPLELLKTNSKFDRALDEADEQIKQVLPRYMVPTAYISLSRIPVLISGKTDRKTLRAFGSKLDLNKLGQAPSTTDAGTTLDFSRELTGIETQLQQVWAQILRVDSSKIHSEDNFFALGGDSVLGMKLVSACKAAGLELSVAGIFANPTLSGMVSVVNASEKMAQEDVKPFSMLASNVDPAKQEAAQACGADVSDIEDMYPCTPTQESLFTFSLKSRKLYVAQRVARIPGHISTEKWKRAWEAVVSRQPILRSRVVLLQDEPGYQQLVLKQGVAWYTAGDLVDYLQRDGEERMELGQALARYAIVEDTKDGIRYMVWTIHHVVYDGWSEPIVLQNVSDALRAQFATESTAQMKNFVHWVRGVDAAEMQQFWRKELEGATGPQFPKMPHRDYVPTPDGVVERTISLQLPPGFAFTIATVIRGAWALVASQYTGEDDVVFGETLTGRDIPLTGVEGIVGPLIATIPIRTRIDRTNSVQEYLQAIQQSMSARLQYQHMGWQNIRKVSRDAQHASECPTGLVIQPEPVAGVVNELGFEPGDVVREALHFNPYPLMLACGMSKEGFRIVANFDSSLVQPDQMQRVLAQLETACHRLMQDTTTLLSEVDCLSDSERNQIWSWNEQAPLAFDAAQGALRADASTASGSTYPRAIVPWVCSPRNSSLLTPIGCVGELWLEGSLLPGQPAPAPCWLLKGSTAYPGRRTTVASTGDLVQLQPDGSLRFVSRKADLLPLQGHIVDVAEVESHVAKHLPDVKTATVIVSGKSSTAEILVFIEAAPCVDRGVQLFEADYPITCRFPGSEQTFEVQLLSTIDTALVGNLKKLDKVMQDALPSYMVPRAYIGLSTLLDRESLSTVATQIPSEILARIHLNLDAATVSMTASLTESERILQSSWSKILRLEPSQIDTDDSFFRLGGDSVLAMKLVSSLRQHGHVLSVADIFQHMRLADAAKVLKLNAVKVAAAKEQTQTYRPFSTLAQSDASWFVSNIIRPKLVDRSWSIQDVLPVTDTQKIDIPATVDAPRTSLQYTLLYFDAPIDEAKLSKACKELIKAHDILRTVFVEYNDSFLQVILNEMNAAVEKIEVKGDLPTCVTRYCEQDSESLRLGSPFLKLAHVHGEDGRQCFIIRLSHAQYDGIALPRMLADLECLYRGAAIEKSASFPEYVAHTLSAAAQHKAQNYWRKVLDGSSPSLLPDLAVQKGDKGIFRSAPVHITERVQEVTTANLLTAAWATILAHRLKITDVVFGSVTSGRAIAEFPESATVAGSCYNTAPVRLTFQPGQTGAKTLQLVQNLTARSAEIDYLGFETIAERCTSWSDQDRARWSLAGSLVHHQDEIEERDIMLFAGKESKVDVCKPGGDAATPLKAVTFTRGGQLHVGIVGGERDLPVVQSLLEELVKAMQGLGGISSQQATVLAQQ